MKFIDETEIFVKAGDGGPGMISFKTARNMPKLGPDGGNGGIGGDVFLKADPGLNTLSTLRYKQHYQAENGAKGGTNNKTGHCGKHCIIPVPIGTIVYSRDFDPEGPETEPVLVGELVTAHQELLIAKGGKRGYGNLHFCRSTRQAPDISSDGEDGDSKALKLELRVMADVGLLGFPNAGKSTLLSRLSEAKPKIANYPFTTLTPQLGVLDFSDIDPYSDSIVMADIPGVIEGASEGRGLGHAFLKHLSRTNIIVFLIDVACFEGRDPYESYQVLDKELWAYSKELAMKRRIVALNKVDMIQDSNELEKIIRIFEKHEIEVLLMSGVTGHGLRNFKIKLKEIVKSSQFGNETL